MFNTIFKGTKDTDHGLYTTTRPSIPAPQPRGELVTIQGRDGVLLVTDDTYEPIEIPVELNYVTRNDLSVGERYRAAKQWIKGMGELSFTDDETVFYKVLVASVTDYSRRTRFGADLMATFICDPFTYFVSGKTAVGPGTLRNNYELAKPIYQITGEGVVTLRVNGNTLSANVGQNMTIDTDLMLTYRQNGTSEEANTTGATYEDLWLKPGNNTVSISGGTLQIIPNWRTL